MGILTHRPHVLDFAVSVDGQQITAELLATCGTQSKLARMTD